MEVTECKVLLCGGFTAEQTECLQAAWRLRGKCKQHSFLCHSRLLLCSTIKCSLLLGGGITQCVNVIWVGDEGNGTEICFLAFEPVELDGKYAPALMCRDHMNKGM